VCSSDLNPATTWGEVFGRYPEIGDIYNKITEIQSKDSEIHTRYLYTIYDYWENDFKSALTSSIKYVRAVCVLEP
jgi:hypothetical protein